MKRISAILIISLGLCLTLSACAPATPPPTPTAIPTAVPTETPVPVPSDTPLPPATNTPQAAQSGSGSSSTPCIISTDKTYGYTEANAVRVGGGDFDGPPREDAYLNNLLGPQGQPLTYNRPGSLDYGDTILDEFVISGAGKPITLYIDEYTYTDPQAPVGLTCLSDFPLTKP